jgi:hypothetical protein
MIGTCCGVVCIFGIWLTPAALGAALPAAQPAGEHASCHGGLSRAHVDVVAVLAAVVGGCAM